RTIVSSRVSRAQDALQAANLTLAADLLDACSPEARFWDWHYLRRQCLGGALVLYDGFRCVAIRDDGRQLAAVATGTGGKEVRLRDWQTGRARNLAGAEQPLTTLAFRPNVVPPIPLVQAGEPSPSILAGGTEDGALVLWDTESGQVVARKGAAHN